VSCPAISWVNSIRKAETHSVDTRDSTVKSSPPRYLFTDEIQAQTSCQYPN
jgi:hypothetical protein